MRGFVLGAVLGALAGLLAGAMLWSGKLAGRGAPPADATRSLPPAPREEGEARSPAVTEPAPERPEDDASVPAGLAPRTWSNEQLLVELDRLSRALEEDADDASIRRLIDVDSEIMSRAGTPGLQVPGQTLRRLLRHPEPRVRAVGAGLCHTGTPLIKELAQMARRDPEELCRGVALQELGRIVRKWYTQDPRGVDAMVGAASDSSSVVRQVALRELGLVRDPGPEVAATIRAALQDPDEQVRQTVLRQLAQLGPERADIALSELPRADGSLVAALARAIAKGGRLPAALELKCSDETLVALSRWASEGDALSADPAAAEAVRAALPALLAAYHRLDPEDWTPLTDLAIAAKAWPWIRAAVLAPEEPRPLRIGLLEGLLSGRETSGEGLELVGRLLRDERSTAGVRIDVVELLGSWKEREGVVDLLRRVAEEDADARVCEAARRAME